MGIPTDPESYEYGDDCLTCWGPGQTPKHLYVYISGVKTGDLWNPALPPPPNGGYVLTQVAPCQWRSPLAPHYVCFYDTDPTGSFVIVTVNAHLGFTGGSEDPCVFTFDNSLPCHLASYCGGSAVVVQIEPGASAPSIADIMELLNMQGRESRKSEVFPLDSDHLVAMIADQVESTRIRIKYKFT